MGATFARVQNRLFIELLALRRTLFFHEQNNNKKKFLIFVLVTTWAVITVGIAYNQAVSTEAYSMLTALVWALIGRFWGDEVAEIAKDS